jgi:hypothetical protein
VDESTYRIGSTALLRLRLQGLRRLVVESANPLVDIKTWRTRWTAQQSAEQRALKSVATRNVSSKAITRRVFDSATTIQIEGSASCHVTTSFQDANQACISATREMDADFSLLP